jgi:hypothetical protein
MNPSETPKTGEASDAITISRDREILVECAYSEANERLLKSFASDWFRDNSNHGTIYVCNERGDDWEVFLRDS